MGALGAAISGLQASQKWLDVVSNNVSNSNTVGFKMGRASFSDLISDGLRNASGASSQNNLGGQNPTQIGLGVSVSTVQNIMKQGALQVTGNAADVAITGKGFFTVVKGQQELFTRAGNFTFDNFGNLVTPDGGLVQGWSVQIQRQGLLAAMIVGNPVIPNYDPSQVGNIQIPENLVLGPRATSLQLNPQIKDEGVIIKGNLDANTPQNVNAGAPPGTAGWIPDAVTTFVVYDSLGVGYTMQLSFVQTVVVGTGPATWEWWLNDVSPGRAPANGVPWGPPLGGGNLVANGAGLTFNADGSIADNGFGAGGNNMTIAMAVTNGASAPFQFSLNFGSDNASAGIGLRDGITGDYGDGTFDAFGVYQPVQTVYTDFVDGYPEGSLIGIGVDQIGQVNATFSNEQTLAVAQLALTKFQNSEGLNKAGGNYYTRTANSGQGQVGTAGSAGFGTTQGGALEQSNVDLTIELTNMIIAQRMFESNARMVTTADRVLDTLVKVLSH